MTPGLRLGTEVNSRRRTGEQRLHVRGKIAVEGYKNQELQDTESRKGAKGWGGKALKRDLDQPPTGEQGYGEYAEHPTSKTNRKLG